jgi:hypothetical protein
MPPSKIKMWSLPHIPLLPKVVSTWSPRPKLCCCLSHSCEPSVFYFHPLPLRYPNKQSVKPLPLWAPIKTSNCHTAECKAASSPPQRPCHRKLLALISSARATSERSVGVRQSSVVRPGDLLMVFDGFWPRSHWEMHPELPKEFKVSTMATKLVRKGIFKKWPHFSLSPKQKCSPTNLPLADLSYLWSHS